VINYQTTNAGSTCLHLAVNQYSEVWLVEAVSPHAHDGSDDDDDG
jgi:hypothetical protein